MNARIEPAAAAANADGYWDIAMIVAELRDLRDRSLADRQRTADRPPRLPSRKALVGILDGLTAVLFPIRLGAPDLTDETIDYFVGHTLDAALKHLLEQVRRELQFASDQEALGAADRERARALAHALAARLPEVRAILDSDIRAAYEGDPAACRPAATSYRPRCARKRSMGGRGFSARLNTVSHPVGRTSPAMASQSYRPGLTHEEQQ